MITRRPGVVSQAATLVVAAVACLGLDGRALAQHTPDPYNIVGEYNSQYEPYMYATFPTTAGTLPNEGRIRSGYSNANSFQSYLDSDGDEGGFGTRSGSARSSGPGVPYYQAYRQYDQVFGRAYRPNDLADRTYYNNQKDLNDKYFQAVRESDPRKRAALMREYTMEQMRTARTLSGGRNTGDRDRDIKRDRPSAGGSRFGDDMEPEDTPTPARSPAPAPGARGRSGTLPSSTAPLPRASTRTPGSPSPSRRATGANPDRLLERSDLLERASRATAPVVPASPAPR